MRNCITVSLRWHKDCVTWIKRTKEGVEKYRNIIKYIQKYPEWHQIH